MSEWTDWTDCSLSCGGQGTQKRSRHCIEPSNGGFACPDGKYGEAQTCDAPACPGKLKMLSCIYIYTHTH